MRYLDPGPAQPMQKFYSIVSPIGHRVVLQYPMILDLYGQIEILMVLFYHWHSMGGCGMYPVQYNALQDFSTNANLKRVMVAQ